MSHYSKFDASRTALTKKLSRTVSVWLCAFSVLLNVPAGAQVVPVVPPVVGEASAATDLAFARGDLDFILQQIKIAEEHVKRGGGCETLTELIPSALLPWGLRTVDGSCNNLLPDKGQLGAADEVFREAVEPQYGDAQPLTVGLLSDNDAIGALTSYRRGDGSTVEDSQPRLISRLITNNSISNPAARAAAAAAEEIGAMEIGPDITGVPQYFIPNAAPDEGLSAPTNAWMTFFGQFFDHGLDLIEKGGNGIVVIPLAEDDPLFDANSDMNFQLLTRTTRDAGPDGMIGTADDVASPINRVTNHVDQQQTYSGHSSAQILLRHYTLVECLPESQPVGQQLCLAPTGELLDGFGNDRTLDTHDDGGLATWNTVKAQARLKLGIALDDLDGADQPMFLADQYGAFIPGAERGLPQLITGYDVVTGAPQLVEGNVAEPVDATQALRIHHSVFLDIAHTADPGKFVGAGINPERLPDSDSIVNPRSDMLAGQETRGVRFPGAPIDGVATYDDELLGEHFICGDGRCNENIALTAVHSIFHREHNRLSYNAKRSILDTRDLAFINQWMYENTPITQADLDGWAGLSFSIGDASLVNQATTKTSLEALDFGWDGERIFQAARFATEMQYNRIVFDEFSPTLSALKDGFVFTNQNSIDPRITAEFAHSVYRFGHSMLTEKVDRFDSEFNTIVDPSSVNPNTAADQLGLFEAFLNPTAFRNRNDETGLDTLTPEEATGAILRGITRQVSSEIDEFVTGALQNNLVGLPLDLGALNIARGRETGVPRLNAARRLFHKETGDTALAPYRSWLDYADNLRHPESLVNFVAAYGTHPLVAGEDRIAGNNSPGEPGPVEDRRHAACQLVSGIALDPLYCEASGFVEAGTEIIVPVDAADFMRSQGAWAPGADGFPISGMEEVDFWVGGIAEEKRPFQGYLGSTHNFVFESQMEALQNGDRLYYLHRTAGIPLLASLESNSFTSIVMRNSDLGKVGGGSLPSALFSAPHHYLEVIADNQIIDTDPEPEEAFFDLVIRDPLASTSDIAVAPNAPFLQYTGGDHVVIGGSIGPDTMIGGIGDDSIWGRDGDDRIEGGDGADHIEGGGGNDIITDLSGPDVIEGGDGHDAINAGNGPEDFIFGDAGSDFLVNPYDFAELFGGPGNDFLYDGWTVGHHRGGAGDDWIENRGSGEEIMQGDFGMAPEFGVSPEKGHDVIINLDGNADIDMENGDDIGIDGPGMDIFEGSFGFDWASFTNDNYGVSVDFDLRVSLLPVFPPSPSNYQNRFAGIEGLSGSAYSDLLRGTDNLPGIEAGNEMSIVTDANGRVTEDGFALIEGLNSTAGRFGLVPESERRELSPDNVTGESQFGWMGEIILGGGSSDLLVGEGGVDILDGDSAIDVAISTPDPLIRTGEANLNLMLAQVSVDATTAQLTTLESDRTLAAITLAVADANLLEVEGNLDAIQSAALVTLDTAMSALMAATAVMEQASATALTANVEHGALNGNVVVAQISLQAAMDASDSALAGLQTILDTQTDYASERVAKEAAIALLNESHATSLIELEQLNLVETSMTAAAVDMFMMVMTCENAAPPSDCAVESSAYETATLNMMSAMSAANLKEEEVELFSSVMAGLVDDLDDIDVAWTAANESASSSLMTYEGAVEAVTSAEEIYAAAETQLAAQTEVLAAAHLALMTAQDAEGAAQAAHWEAEQAAGESLVAMETATTEQAMAASGLAVLESDVALVSFANEQSLAAVAEAMAAMPDDAGNNILVKSMMDVNEAVFMGAIIPNELSIHRAINDHDPEDLGFDAVQYTGNFGDYSIESHPGADGIPGTADDPAFNPLDPGALIGDFYSWNAVTSEIVASPDGFIEIIDDRVGPGLGPDGRDLVRNIERLIFDDQVVDLVPGAAGASSNATNTPAQGRITVTPAVAVVGDTLVASMASVTDADGILEDTIAFRWTVELAPGSGVFEPIIRVGAPGFGDAFTPNGPVLDVNIEEAGLQIRVEALFSDTDGAFEFVRSDAVLVGCPLTGCPAALGVLIPAAFAGTPADILAAIDAANTAVAPVPFVENVSAPGSSRIEVSVGGLPRGLFVDTGFPDVITAADTAPLTGVTLTFSDSTGAVTASFIPDVGARIDPETGLVDQELLDITFSLRDVGVLAAVTPPYTTVSMSVNGVEAANAILFGDPSVDFGQNLAVVLINQSPPIQGANLDSFVGPASILVEPAQFVNQSVPDGSLSATFVIPSVEVTGLSVGFGGVITPSEQAYISEGISLRLDETVAVPPLTQARTKEIYRPVARAHFENGVVTQGVVDLVFEIEREVGSDLINGLTYATLEVPGLGSGQAHQWILFGDSANAPQDVIVLTSAVQLAAAAGLIQATEIGDANAVLGATQTLTQANLSQAIVSTQNLPGGPSALLTDTGLPHANYVGGPGGVSAVLGFENASRVGEARFEFTVPNVRLDDFIGHGFSNPVVATDVSLVDSFSLYALTDFGALKGIYLAEMVAQVDALTGLVSQDEVTLSWSFRGDEVLSLVSGITVFSAVVNGSETSSILLSGDSMNNDGLGVVQVPNAAMLSAQALLASAFVGDVSAAQQASLLLTQVLITQLDPDADGLFGLVDPCPFDPDNDADGDGVCGDVDSCSGVSNPDQLDSDGDGLGDVCDNCRYVANSATSLDAGGMSQRDSDSDGHGNMCDADFNNDGVVNFGDLNILQLEFHSQEAIHTDMSGDGVCNFAELALFQKHFGKEVGTDIRE